MAAPEKNISDGFTEAAGDTSAAAQDVRVRQYERLCKNFQVLRRKYDSLKEVHQELLWGEAGLAHDAGLVAELPAVDESLVEEAHRVGDVATGATLDSGACGGVFEGTWPDGRPCAVKRISKRDAETLQEVRNVASELEALRLLSGAPHALELQAALASRDYLYFVVERFGEELYALLKRDETALTSAQQAGVVHGVAARAHALAGPRAPQRQAGERAPRRRGPGRRLLGRSREALRPGPVDARARGPGGPGAVAGVRDGDARRERPRGPMDAVTGRDPQGKPAQLRDRKNSAL